MKYKATAVVIIAVLNFYTHDSASATPIYFIYF